MAKNLVIVESPAKAKTIEKFLGADYHVLSCFGHVRDLPKSKLHIDLENNFEPHYEVPADKKKLISELKAEAKKANFVWLASDEDREGEAIAWHLEEVLKLNEAKTKRIVFNEITKPAILKAIANPRHIDRGLVDAQQARRVLDRLVGYEISPVLWKKVRPQLSAGRVQSVAVRLVVERENEIKNFQQSSAFRVLANFSLVNNSAIAFEAELNKRFEQKNDALKLFANCQVAQFSISDVETKPSKKSPAPPFTTSTLQQEASRKLGFSVTRTMVVAQQLYEQGYITYMRTDSVNLSDTALAMAKEQIVASFGEKYVKIRKFSAKSKGAQEAHEAIRPTAMDRTSVKGDAAAMRLYDLIWKRTVASQMSDAEIEKTQAIIDISNAPEKFIAKGEVLLFDGFLRLYLESKDDEDEDNEKGQEKMLPAIKSGDFLNLQKAQAKETYTQHPPRYAEASLVKKMEELGIGRPSTFAPTISTIQKREYVVKEDREASIRTCQLIVLEKNKIEEKSLNEKTGAEKGKLFPTDIGSLVNQFLMDNFDSVVDYNFTAKVEKEFDEVALGKLKWTKMIEAFYNPFHKQVESTMQNTERVSGERLLGVDPNTGKNIYVKLSRFGPVAQIGESNTDEKPTFAGLKKGQSIDTITFDEVLELFKLPRTIGVFEDKEMIAAIGRFGPYIRHNSVFISIPKTDDPLEITQERAVELILNKRKAEAEKIIKVLGKNNEISILNGRFGPYLSFEKENYKIPKTLNAADLTLEECNEIIKGGSTKSKSKSFGKKASAATKAAPAKKATTKKGSTTKTATKKVAATKARPAKTK